MIIVNNYNNNMINLKSKVSRAILDYFLLNRKEALYVNELARLLKIDPGNTFRKLKEFESEGILLSEFRGNQKYYFLNAKYPWLKEYEKLYEAKFGFSKELQEKLSNLAGLEEAFIFGSFAKGNFSDDSDIDLLVIGKHNLKELAKIISNLESRFGREINVVDFEKSEFLKRKKAGDDFIKNILSNKTIKIK